MDFSFSRMNGGGYPVFVGLPGLILSALLLYSSAALAERLPQECGSLANHYGPYDYSNPTHRSRYLPIVEKHHFSKDVFALRKPGDSGTIGEDIAYTLHTFPNHHRALDAMSRLSIREGRATPSRARYTIDCYFQRAIEWRPKDADARMVYGLHHYRSGRLDAAIDQMREGVRISPNHAELQYNLGLLLVRKQDYSAALEHAKKAYGLGYPLPGLRNQLERLGEWSE